MRLVGTLVRRNLRGYWRDPMTVFFSVLGPLILFILFVIFYRDQVSNLIVNTISGATLDDAHTLCDEWLFASVTAMATFTSSVGLLTGFVDDRSTGRFSDYLVAPVRRWQLTVGYVMSSLIVSVVLSSLIVVLGQGWALAYREPLLSGSQDLRIIGGVVVACLFFSAFNTLVVTFTATQGSFGGYFIIMGTAMGFLAFCYVPPASLPDGVNSFLSVLPFAQVAALLRTPAMEPAIDILMKPITDETMRDKAQSGISHDLAMSLSAYGNDLSVAWMIGSIAILTVVLAVAGTWRMGRVIR